MEWVLKVSLVGSLILYGGVGLFWLWMMHRQVNGWLQTLQGGALGLQIVHYAMLAFLVSNVLVTVWSVVDWVMREG